MSQAYGQDRKAGCVGKERYASAQRAWKVLNRRNAHKPHPLAAYHCKFCGGWHHGEAHDHGR